MSRVECLESERESIAVRAAQLSDENIALSKQVHYRFYLSFKFKRFSFLTCIVLWYVPCCSLRGLHMSKHRQQYRSDKDYRQKMELERKIVRLTIRRLRKALKKFHTDIEAANQEKLQLQIQQSPAAAFASSVELRCRGVQQVIASFASMPPGQHDARRRPWKKCVAAHENNSAVTLNGHIEDILGTSVLSEGPGILSWIENGIQELQLKEIPEAYCQVAQRNIVHKA